MPAFALAPAHFIEGMSDFVRAEFACQRRTFSENCALPIEERIEKGICLAGLTFQGLDERGLARFGHAGNDSRLREGDRVRLNRGEPESGHSAAIFREELGQIWLSSENRFKATLFDEEPKGWMIDEDFIDLEGHYLAALERLPRTEIGQEYVLPLLMGDGENDLDEEEYEATFQELDEGDEHQHWEDKQKEAIAACLAAKRCYLVQGPPGTGKTRVLGQVAAQLVARGERVLITSATHRAIDNALSAVARELGDRDRVARFAVSTHRRSADYDTFETWAESPLAEHTGWVAGATSFALHKRLPGIEFDTIIIDEASQMTTPLAIIAMLTGRRYLLFGDQQQLGPVILSRPRREVGPFSIFHALKNHEKSGTMLDITYRLNERLTEWPSDNFYHGDLQPAPASKFRRLQWTAAADTESWVSQALSPEHPLVWIPFPASNRRTHNPAEVAVAARLLQALTERGVARETIAVVTPYRRQARHLRNRIEQLLPGATWRQCVIDTVERMQGQEREVILVSLCASEPEFIMRQIQFLFDPRRLNVSATRARTKLIILANDNLTSFDPFDSDDQEDIDLLRSLKRAAVQVTPPDQP